MKDSERFVITHEGALDNAYQVMKHMLSENGWLKIECKAGNRTLSQNALYWVWMAQLAAEFDGKKVTYYDEELKKEVTEIMEVKPTDMHERMKHEFLGYDDPKRIGKTVIPSQLKSTAKLSKGDMFAYMERIDMFWAERGVLLVTPDDSVYAQLKAKNEGR